MTDGAVPRTVSPPPCTMGDVSTIPSGRSSKDGDGGTAFAAVRAARLNAETVPLLVPINHTLPLVLAQCLRTVAIAVARYRAWPSDKRAPFRLPGASSIATLRPSDWNR